MNKKQKLVAISVIAVGVAFAKANTPMKNNSIEPQTNYTAHKSVQTLKPIGR
jgi:mannose/fructose/N-acetylgalactosamine-specific phosphotransferase system component IIC